MRAVDLRTARMRGDGLAIAFLHASRLERSNDRDAAARRILCADTSCRTCCKAQTRKAHVWKSKTTDAAVCTVRHEHVTCNIGAKVYITGARGSSRGRVGEVEEIRVWKCSNDATLLPCVNAPLSTKEGVGISQRSTLEAKRSKLTLRCLVKKGHTPFGIHNKTGSAVKIIGDMHGNVTNIACLMTMVQLELTRPH